MDYNETITPAKGYLMNVAEIFIFHTLLGNPGMMHVTPDNKKLYFLVKGNLMYIEGDFKDMGEEELNLFLQKALTSALN